MGTRTSEGHDRQVAQAAAAAGLERVYRFRWNATQVVVIVAGIFLMALGGIALARAGNVGITDAVAPEVAVGPWHRTPLMASIELGLGLLLILSGAQRLAPRALYRIAGALALVFGIVLITQPATFDSVLGTSRPTGWLYAVVGVGMLGIGFGAPLVFERERTVPVDEEEPASNSSDKPHPEGGEHVAGEEAMQ